MNEKEKQFLSKMHKALGQPEVSNTFFVSQSEKRKKENDILKLMESKLNKLAGTQLTEGILTPKGLPVIDEVISATIPEEEPVVDIVETIEPIMEIGRQPEPELPKDDIINKYVVALSKTNQQDGGIQQVADSIPDVYRKELDILKKSVADFHRFAQRHSQLGGGGAGSIEDLTFHTTSVTSSNYQIGRKDYYIGVNYPGPVSISLPIQNVKEGRQVVVKDESGLCSVNNITISGISIDNDTQAILAINNGSLTFIYSRGWRII